MEPTNGNDPNEIKPNDGVSPPNVPADQYQQQSVVSPNPQPQLQSYDRQPIINQNQEPQISQKTNSNSNIKFIVIGVLVLALIFLFLGYLLLKDVSNSNNSQQNQSTESNESKNSNDALVEEDVSPEPISQADVYQAVYLTNGKIYFGKLSSNSDDIYTLSKVMYLNGGSYAGNGEITAQEGEQVTLTVLYVDEYDTRSLTLKKNEIAKWENMDESSKISRAISDYESSLYNTGPQ